MLASYIGCAVTVPSDMGRLGLPITGLMPRCSVSSHPTSGGAPAQSSLVARPSLFNQADTSGGVQDLVTTRAISSPCTIPIFLILVRVLV